ncbi:MAG: M23 family metallopeptidase [Gemmatimonadota bacterium]|nr:MAG: M23 family metallopeptidase [Gemmatimonadota bacterium]
MIRRCRRAAFNAPLALAAIAAAACAGIPEPPAAPPEPEPPQLEPLRFFERWPDPPAPQPLAPHLRWEPSSLSEGTFAIITVLPDGRGLPIFEAAARADDRPIPLYRMPGGSFFGLVAAPLNAEKLSVDLSFRLFDGTLLSRTLSLHVSPRRFTVTQLRVATRFTQPDPTSLERIQLEQALVRATLRKMSTTPLWHGAFLRPLEGAVTSPYGQRRMFNDELRSRHTGLDIGGDTGDLVRASNAGRIVISRDLYFNGNAVFIDHGLGLFTGYFHLSAREVAEGQWVEKGQIVGRVGATGRVTGPHLHWGLYLQGASLDPSALLEPDFTRLSLDLPPQPATLLLKD